MRHRMVDQLGGHDPPYRRAAPAQRLATQVADLRRVLPEVGFDYDVPAGGGGGSYQETCPRCRRRLVALAQPARVRGFG